MKFVVSTLFLLFITGYVLAQNFDMDIHHKKVGDYIRVEKSWGHLKVENKSNYLSGKGVAQPIIYRTQQKNLPDLFTYYFYYSSDSSIYYILHEWDDVNMYGYNSVSIKPDVEVIPYKDKYNQLLSYIIKLYGISKTTGSLDKDADGSINRKDVWNPNDTTTIEMYTVLSGKSISNGRSTIAPTYRIRLYIYNTSKRNTKTPALDKNTSTALDSTFQLFYNDIKNEYYEDAKVHLSNKIQQTTTIDAIKNLASNIRFSTELKIYFVGIQMMQDGNQYTMLHYKYIDDTNSPPAELLKVVFDEKNKILAIQPTKKM